MFREVTNDVIDRFRLIYHQTTPYSNPIIESVLYQNKGGGGMYYCGDLLDANSPSRAPAPKAAKFIGRAVRCS